MDSAFLPQRGAGGFDFTCLPRRVITPQPEAKEIDSEAEYRQGMDYENKKQYTEALKHFEAAASKSHLLALSRIGQYHEKGIGVQKDSQKAVDYYLKGITAVPPGYPNASNLLRSYIGNIYWEKKEFEMAAKFLKEAADGGYKDFQYDYALFSKKRGDIPTAIAYYEMAGSQSHRDAQYNLALLVEKTDPKKAFEIFKLAARDNDPQALTALGDSYRYGSGCEVNINEAITCYRLAVTHEKAPEAYFSLAQIYYNGIGIKKDQNFAISYCKKAAKQGHLEAKCILGSHYEFVEKNLEKALEYYRDAADNGDSETQYRLGVYHRADNNLPEALRRYIQAAAQDHPEALFQLGAHYYSGVGVQECPITALGYYEKAAKLGDPQANWALGYYHDKGVVVDKDLKKAFEYFEKASKLGNADADYELSYCYEEGIVVDKDLKKAFEYRQAAANGGHKAAQFELGAYYSEEGDTQNLSEAIKYYELAAAQDHSKALYKLGWHYYAGIGVVENDEIAKGYLIRAANFKDSAAMYAMNILGEYYEKGIRWKRIPK